MSRSLRLCRMIIGAMVLVSCLVMANQRMTCQAICSGCTQPDDVWRVQLCMAPQPNITVDITVCNQNFCPAQLYTHPCTPTQSINARTVIKKICPVGWTGTGVPIQLILTKLLTSLGPCCSGQTYYPACAQNPDFLLLLSYSKCWEQDAATKCWTPCVDAPCCSNLVQYRPNFPNQGDCSAIIIGRCDDPGMCSTSPSQPCETIDCNLTVEPCCP